MNNKIYLALAALAAAAVLAYALLFRATDEDLIRQKLTALESAVKSGDSEPQAAARPLRVQQAFSRIFAPRVRVDAPELGEGDRTREELAELVYTSEERIPGLHIAFSRVHLEIDARALPPRADVAALTTVTGTDRGDATRMRNIYQVTLHFEKNQEEWRITRIGAARVN